MVSTEICSSGVRSLSVEEWSRLSKQDIHLPITVFLRGISMEPLIRSRKDQVTIVPVDRALLPGDIVLFQNTDGLYVLHRLYKISRQKEMVCTYGDDCREPDPPVPVSSVLGIAISVRKKEGRVIRLDTETQRRKGLKWLHSWRKAVFVRYRRLRLKTGNRLRELGIIE